MSQRISPLQRRAHSATEDDVTADDVLPSHLAKHGKRYRATRLAGGSILFEPPVGSKIAVCECCNKPVSYTLRRDGRATARKIGRPFTLAEIEAAGGGTVSGPSCSFCARRAEETPIPSHEHAALSPEQRARLEAIPGWPRAHPGCPEPADSVIVDTKTGKRVRLADLPMDELRQVHWNLDGSFRGFTVAVRWLADDHDYYLDALDAAAYLLDTYGRVEPATT